MRVLVVDIDNTLIVTPKISRFFWLLSWLFQMVARRLQQANVKIVKLFDEYDKVIILSGREMPDSESTKRQLKLLHVPFDGMILCPRTNLVSRWKISVVRGLTETYRGDIWWIDDELNKSIPIDGLRSRHFRIVPLKIEDIVPTLNGSKDHAQNPS